MRKTYSIVIVSILIMTLFGCKGTKEISKVNQTTEIEIPLSGKDYVSNKDYYRARQVGESTDLSTAKKIAMQNAKSEMAGNIQAMVKRVTDQYTNQRAVNDKTDFENKFEELSREVVNQTLTDVKVIGEKLFKENEGKYQYWIAIESSKENVLKGIQDKISNDEKLKLDFDKYQYEKIFNEEMKKFEQE